MESIGFDDTSSWMLYDENLQNLFNWMESNITKENVITDQEILLDQDLKSRNALLSEEECNRKLSELSTKFEGIMNNENIDVEISDLEQEIRVLEKLQETYEEVDLEMKQNLEGIKAKTANMERKIIDLQTLEKQAQEKCVSLANEVQQVQKENKRLSNEAEDCFSRIVRFWNILSQEMITFFFISQKTPALFMHQMPLDHYFQKTENFMNYVKIYMKENFKICVDEEQEVPDGVLDEDVERLDSIRKT